MTYISKHRLNVASVPGPSIPVGTREIRQPAKPGIAKSSSSFPQQYYLNDSRLSIIAEHSKLHGFCELEEVTSVHGQPAISDMALIVVSYGYDALRFNASQKAIARLNKADPAPGKKIFIEVSKDDYHFEYLKDQGWDYRALKMNDRMDGLFQKEPLWTIGTKLAFQDPSINKVVLVDADCAFHDNSWTYLTNEKLNKFEFVQPFAAILYSNQKEYADTIPSIAYCIHTNQKHWLAVPGGAYACTRDFFFNILGGSWPVNPVGSGDDQFWKYLYGHTPIVSNESIKALAPIGRFHAFKIGYAPLLLNHYYHGPMSNRMYGTRKYIADRCITGTETIYNNDGLLEWSTNKIGTIMQKSMTDLKRQTNSYLQVNRRFTLPDTKDMFKQICQNEIGRISETYPLKIVTSYRKHGAIHMEQINILRDAVKRTFKCPYRFYIASDDSSINHDYLIHCDIPSYLIPVGYEWIMYMNNQHDPGVSILYIDPNVKMTGTCDMVRCEENEVYLAHTGRSWSTKLMYFHDLSAIYQRFKQDVLAGVKLDKLYPDSVYYLLSQLQSTQFQLRDVLFHLDYESGKATEKTTNFTI